MKETAEKIDAYTYKISEHVPIAIGYSCNGNRKSYFGSNCMKDYVKDLLEIETRYSVKLNK